MLRLNCHCGYPLWVAAHWTGSTIALFLLDGTRVADRTQPPLQQCPQCQTVLHPDQLEGYPIPPSSAAQPGAAREPLPPASAPPAARPPQPSAPQEPQDRSEELFW